MDIFITPLHVWHGDKLILSSLSPLYTPPDSLFRPQLTIGVELSSFADGFTYFVMMPFPNDSFLRFAANSFSSVSSVGSIDLQYLNNSFNDNQNIVVLLRHTNRSSTLIF